MSEEPDGEMGELEYLRAKFFSPVGEIERAHAERDARLAKRRSAYAAQEEFRVMKRVVKVFGKLEPHAIRAWINWLDSAYRGGKFKA